MPDTPAAEVEEKAVVAPVAQSAAQPPSLSSRLTLSLSIGVFVGLLSGVAAPWGGFWPWLAAAFIAVTILLLHHHLSEHWLAPVKSLADDVDACLARRRPAVGCKAMADRPDDLGRLARGILDLSVDTFRCSIDAQQLRRTIDQRVAHATRKATLRLTQMAMRDPLTNLANRRFMQENLDEVMASCRASGLDLFCLAVDLDNFKAVNDTAGHAVGDELLVNLSQIIKTTIRADDFAVRHGGDEFLLFLPGCEMSQAHRIASRITELFGQYVRMRFPTPPKPGMSIGAASLARDKPADGNALVAAADHRLYVGKQSGKGRIIGLDA
jgi:diguanylate cyclase (GGDEF)-like protein